MNGSPSSLGVFESPAPLMVKYPHSPTDICKGKLTICVGVITSFLIPYETSLARTEIISKVIPTPYNPILTFIPSHQDSFLAWPNIPLRRTLINRVDCFFTKHNTIKFGVFKYPIRRVSNHQVHFVQKRHNG